MHFLGLSSVCHRLLCSYSGCFLIWWLIGDVIPFLLSYRRCGNILLATTVTASDTSWCLVLFIHLKIFSIFSWDAVAITFYFYLIFNFFNYNFFLLAYRGPFYHGIFPTKFGFVLSLPASPLCPLPPFAPSSLSPHSFPFSCGVWPCAPSLSQCFVSPLVVYIW